MIEQATMLKAENIHKRLGGNKVLRGVGIDVPKGAVKVIIGPSGSGKSTFLQCLNFLHMPDQGTVWLDGQEIKAKNRRELSEYRQHVGMIFQDFNLFDHLTALENVRIALS